MNGGSGVENGSGAVIVDCDAVAEEEVVLENAGLTVLRTSKNHIFATINCTPFSAVRR